MHFMTFVMLLQLMQLQQQLAAREQEVAALREIAEAAAELQSTDVSQQKVLELSKKVIQQHTLSFVRAFGTLQHPCNPCSTLCVIADCTYKQL